MINATVLVPSKNKHFTNKDNEHTMSMINVCRKKFKLALLCSILVMVPVDMHLFARSFPIFLWSILCYITLVAYLIFDLRWRQRSYCNPYFIYSHMIMVVLIFMFSTL